MKKPEQIFIAGDHAGFKLKKFLIHCNPDQNWKDLGVFNEKTSHYPEQAELLCKHLLKNKKKLVFGVLICGSGQGMAMKANRFSGIRAALAWDKESCRLAREHNKANVLCLGARRLSAKTANDIFCTFIGTTFKAGRHHERVRKLG